MNTKAVAAAVTGARHLRLGRNGQDAAGAWVGAGAGAIVVCDGCGAGASSEVGARLGARLVLAALAARLARGASPTEATVWAEVRAEVGAALAQIVVLLGPPAAREALVHEHLLFTIVAAAVRGDALAVWTLGDGGFAFGADAPGPAIVRGPFADNQPPYLAYDLVARPAAAELVTATLPRGVVVVATDGVAEVGLDAALAGAPLARYLAHPDALRRRLAVLARGGERIDWDARCIARTPAVLQDDGAVGVLAWGPA